MKPRLVPVVLEIYINVLCYFHEASGQLIAYASSPCNSLCCRVSKHLHLKKNPKFQNCQISCPYSESACKMHPNEYKQAYVWSSGSWDSMWYLKREILPLESHDTSLGVNEEHSIHWRYLGSRMPKSISKFNQLIAHERNNITKYYTVLSKFLAWQNIIKTRSHMAQYQYGL